MSGGFIAIGRPGGGGAARGRRQKLSVRFAGGSSVPFSPRPALPCPPGRSGHRAPGAGALAEPEPSERGPRGAGSRSLPPLLRGFCVGQVQNLKLDQCGDFPFWSLTDP